MSKKKGRYLEDMADYVFPHITPATYIYFIMWRPFKKIGRHDRVKIGISKDPEKRLQSLQTANAHKLILWYYFRVPKAQAKEIEKRLHGKFRWSRERGEWFSIHPAVLNWIKAHSKAMVRGPVEKPESRTVKLRKATAPRK